MLPAGANPDGADHLVQAAEGRCETSRRGIAPGRVIQRRIIQGQAAHGDIGPAPDGPGVGLGPAGRHIGRGTGRGHRPGARLRRRDRRQTGLVGAGATHPASTRLRS